MIPTGKKIFLQIERITLILHSYFKKKFNRLKLTDFPQKQITHSK